VQLHPPIASVRDAWAVTTHSVTYEGPPALAVDVARILADAEGIELTGAAEPQQHGNVIVLALTVEATPDMVAAAVRGIAEGLPDGATISAVPGRA
jgi:hypothetical protein